jgi:serine/threonine protein kinase
LKKWPKNDPFSNGTLRAEVQRTMDPAAALAPASMPGGFEDGLGKRRYVADPNGGGTLEVLCLRSELTAVPAFEFALRERASRLATFRQASFGHVRSVDRLTMPGTGLAIVSEFTAGVRLSKLLGASEHRRLDINAAIHLIRQLVSATALLHEHARDVAHGAIGPERLIVTPNARLVLVEHVLGGALEQLHYSHERYWSELRIALPRSIGLPRFDQRADVTQIGVVALSLILGRMLHDDEYPSKIADVLGSARSISSRGGSDPLPSGLRTWLSRALQLDSRTAFANAIDASAAFDKALEEGDEPGADSAQKRTTAEPAGRVVSDAPATPKPTPSPLAAQDQHGRVEPQKPLETTVTPVPPATRPVAEPQPPVAQIAKASTGVDREEHWNDRFEDRGQADHTEPFVTLDDDEANPPASRMPSPRILAAVAALIAVVVAGGFGARKYFAPTAIAAVTGTVNITTNPAGAEVIIDGRSRGVSPLSIPLNPGPHALELRGASGDPRTMSFNVTAGATVAQFIDMPQVPATGQLQIRTEPAGAQVSVDDTPRGPSPVTVDGLSAGDHTVSVTSEVGSVKQHVTVTPGSTAAVVVPLVASNAPVSGWISVSAPAEVQIFENKKLLGTSESDRIMVSAGRHEFELVNETLGYRSIKPVQVPAGKVASVKADWPKGTMSLNAIPWADVWVDGEKVGETPIGNLQLPVGAHEVIFRNPDLGEQRHAVSVTVGSPTRLSVDMRKK